MLKEALFKRLPRSAYLWIGIIALMILPWVVGASGGNYWVRVLDFALLYIVLALGLNVVVGFAGLLDLGYIAFYALGAYSFALLASPHLPQHFETIAAAFPEGMHFSPWIVAVFSIGLAALFGIILGFPTLQLRGFIQIPGLYLVFYLFLLLVVSVAIICLHLQDSRIGRAWVAIREDEIAAKAMGINTRNMKLLAFAIGASFAGVAGVLFSAFQGFVSPESFTLWESIVVLAMVVLGGIGHIPGVILGAVLLAIFPEVLRGVAQPLQQALFGHVIIDVEIIRQLIYGLALILIMLYRPGGIWQKSRKNS